MNRQRPEHESTRTKGFLGATAKGQDKSLSHIGPYQRR
jgi:hypothetical protein